MFYDIFCGIMVPFLGTALGAALVFFTKKSFGGSVRAALIGAAAGIMTAASIWSLILPAIEQSETDMGRLAFAPAAAGFLLGTGLLMLIDRFVPEPDADLCDDRLLIFAVTLHNIPEGMAVGAVYAGLLYGSTDVTAAGAFALALGIAIQNLPEGAIISMPLHSSGTGKFRSFICGTLSGAVEPVGAVITLAAAGLVVPAMPYLLSFAAGAMIYVVVKELIPEISSGSGCSAVGVTSFSVGFVLMMTLDVALG